MLDYVKRDAIELSDDDVLCRNFFSLSIGCLIVNFGAVCVAVRLTKVRVEMKPLRLR